MTQTAWTTPIQLSAGYTVQGSDWNNSAYANMLFLYDGPMAKYHATADQGIASGTTGWTGRAFQVVDWDTDGIGPGLNSTGQFTIQTAGIYLWVATFRFAAATGGSTRSGRLNLNSGTLIGQTDVTLLSSTLTANGVVTAREYHNSGDVVILELMQDSGASLTNLGSVAPLGYSVSCRWDGPGS